MAEADFSFITYAEMPDLDPDDLLVAQALAKRGYKVQGLIWDDKTVDWSKARNCVLRTTWDYHLKPEAFLDWLDAVARVTTIWNQPSLVRWNSHKTYLLDLERQGVRTVPTLSFAKGSHVDLQRLMDEHKFEKIVVKPAIGLATFGVRKVDRADLEAGQRHIDQLFRNSDVLVQPYMPSIADYGERSLIFIDGEYSHAVRKAAFQIMAAAGHAGETAAQATDDEIACARKIIALVKEPTLYARVDLVQDENHQPCLLELELIEPSLFFSMHLPAVETFADALCKRLK